CRPLATISTLGTVRDLDHLRRLTGERQLTYYGASYGTFLGQTYANVFPHRVRAMVLDGVVDAVRYARGRESALEMFGLAYDPVFARFEAVCERSGPDLCALAGHGMPVSARLNAVLARLRRGPLAAPTGTAALRRGPDRDLPAAALPHQLAQARRGLRRSGRRRRLAAGDHGAHVPAGGRRQAAGGRHRLRGQPGAEGPC